MSDQPDTDDDDIWAVWARSVITIDVDGTPAVAKRDDPPASPLHVLTGWNPGAVEVDRTVNDAANARLADELAARDVTVWPATGSDPDGTWSEPGFAVHGLTRADALELGAAYGQVTIYEITGRDVIIVRCADGAVFPTESYPTGTETG